MRDLVEVAEELGLELEECGDQLRSICLHPGHNDTNPSLYIHPAKQKWFCFSCQKGGSAYGLVRWMMPELSKEEAWRIAVGEGGLAGYLRWTIKSALKQEEPDEAPYLFAALMRQYRGKELDNRIVDTLAQADPLPHLLRLVEGE